MSSTTQPSGASPVTLADPEQRRGSAVIIYDGECRFCRGQVERLARWDRAGLLAFISLHDERVGRWYPDLTHDELMERCALYRRIYGHTDLAVPPAVQAERS